MVTKTQTQTWEGKSGTKYTYEVYSLDTTWNDVPGNYIFAKRTPTGWRPLYIGETSSLKGRLTPLTSHEKYACAKRLGMTHIHAHTSSLVQHVRRAEEKDLVDRFTPACNG